MEQALSTRQPTPAADAAWYQSIRLPAVLVVGRELPAEWGRLGLVGQRRRLVEPWEHEVLAAYTGRDCDLVMAQVRRESFRAGQQRQGHIVISPQVTFAPELPAAHRRAVGDVDLAERLRLPWGSVLSDDLVLGRLLLRVEGHDLRILMQQMRVLTPIELVTLESYLDCDQHTVTTAERMGVHPNTVRYRLNAARRNAGWNLGKAETLTRVSLALRALRLFYPQAFDVPPALPNERVVVTLPPLMLADGDEPADPHPSAAAVMDPLAQ